MECLRQSNAWRKQTPHKDRGKHNVAISMNYVTGIRHVLHIWLWLELGLFCHKYWVSELQNYKKNFAMSSIVKNWYNQIVSLLNKLALVNTWYFVIWCSKNTATCVNPLTNIVMTKLQLILVKTMQSKVHFEFVSCSLLWTFTFSSAVKVPLPPLGPEAPPCQCTWKLI